MPDFVGPFELMLNTERLIQLENYGDKHDDRKCLERVKKLTLLASNYFHSLNVSNHWNVPSNHWNFMSKVKTPGDNCSGEHYSPDCLHPCYKAKNKKAKEERAYCRGGVGCNGG